MTYEATVVQVMIASPSDVPAERMVIRNVLAEWNDLNSQKTGIVLLPVGWETHAVPQLGGRAQEFINRDVLARCDLLVAAFWTKLGSPTGDSPSGTVEEIERHVAAGKPAMVYFSTAPVHLDSVDTEQYQALRQFRSECEGRGLIERYESPTDLHDKLLRQLSRIVDERFSKEQSAEGPPPVLTTSQPTIELSEEAKALLSEAAKDPNGRILYLRVLGGPLLQTNRMQLNESKNPREQAAWESALAELEKHELIHAKTLKRDYFTLTKRGYEVADVLTTE
ncbi:MAG TPA: hypothetical protein VJT67_14075 [Longimicrobiaceae bacterium]|nr:hypothetical protein [Longimicrobiaceae bacterium]